MFGKNNMRYYISKFINKIQISSVKNSEIHNTSKLGSKNNILELKMGRYSYIGNNCTIVNTTINNFCSIADNCIIGGAQHPIEWGSTSPVFHSGKNILKKNFSKHEFKVYENTNIGNDVWIGNNVIIKAGVQIGNGSIIGMGSVVTKNVGNYEIWAGNPAKLIRLRFSEDVVKELMKFQWWEKDDEEILKLSQQINNIDKFLCYLREKGEQK